MLLPTLILCVGIPFVAEVANRPRLAPRSRPVFWFLGAVNLDMPLLATGIAFALEAGLAVGGGCGDRKGLLLLVAPVPPTTLLPGPFRGPGASVMRLALLFQAQLPQALGCGCFGELQRSPLQLSGLQGLVDGPCATFQVVEGELGSAPLEDLRLQDFAQLVRQGVDGLLNDRTPLCRILCQPAQLPQLMKCHDGCLAGGALEVQIPLVDLRGHFREGPLQQGVGVRQNGGVVGRRFLRLHMVDWELKRGHGHLGGCVSWGWWRCRCTSRSSAGRCSRRCCLRRLRLRLHLGLLPSRQLCCLRVVGPLLGRPRFCLELQVLRLHRLVLLPVAVNPGLEMVVEQNPRLPIAALPQHPKLLHLGHRVS
jgi:hypothetical protein